MCNLSSVWIICLNHLESSWIICSVQLESSALHIGYLLHNYSLDCAVICGGLYISHVCIVQQETLAWNFFHIVIWNIWTLWWTKYFQWAPQQQGKQALFPSPPPTPTLNSWAAQSSLLLEQGGWNAFTLSGTRYRGSSCSILGRGGFYPIPREYSWSSLYGSSWN